MSVLEIGCAPGKTLAWLAKIGRCRVAGLDYSERGLGFTRDLFRALAIEGDLRCEGLDVTTFAPGSFDLVFSVGVIEHFDDPRDIVRQHVALTKPGGLTLVVVPNYGGLYGRIQARFDPANLLLHNLAIMTPEALVALQPREMVSEARAYAAGYLSPWLVNFDKRWPRVLAKGVTYFLNGVGLMQPFEIPSLCPSLVLELRRRDHPVC
jgi:2-polyprenyl-3-methyl-5-hydroxy-6-metoxy-1,4-benzoquinol methylase